MLDNSIALLAKELNVYMHKSVNSGYRLFGEGEQFELNWCEGISHSVHAWKHASSDSIFVCTLPWHHTEDLFARARQFVEKVNPSLNASNFVILCNGKDEVESALKSGWENSCLCNHNAWLDERLYSLASKDERDRPYDLVINCRPEIWKRPFVAASVDRLAVIKGYNFRENEYYDLNQLNPIYINEERLDLANVVSILNQSKVGGIFSAIEGGCYSSSEYLLCGLPVISTNSLGGRDVYYNETNSRIIEPDPSQCSQALNELLQTLKSDPSVRSQIRDEHLAMSSNFRRAAYEMIDKALDVRGIHLSSEDIIRKNYRNKMTRYTNLGN